MTESNEELSGGGQFVLNNAGSVGILAGKGCMGTPLIY
ncbi:hypothetical protein MNBD_ALPHA11-52 [hydrothermal vent metagenome]|uniref:Uncharacterized protein n=1 Tax=hydrothermal vent metagenome TaxID=652676 RepID=A0A3B0T746_9ZZZZ